MLGCDSLKGDTEVKRKHNHVRQLQSGSLNNRPNRPVGANRGFGDMAVRVRPVYVTARNSQLNRIRDRGTGRSVCRDSKGPSYNITYSPNMLHCQALVFYVNGKPSQQTDLGGGG
jgi:hypothetical protein